MGTKCLADILSEREKIANWMEVGMMIIMLIIKSQDNDHDNNQDDHHHDNDVNLGMLGISLIAAKGRA